MRPLYAYVLNKYTLNFRTLFVLAFNLLFLVVFYQRRLA